MWPARRMLDISKIIIILHTLNIWLSGMVPTQGPTVERYRRCVDEESRGPD